MKFCNRQQAAVEPSWAERLADEDDNPLAIFVVVAEYSERLQLLKLVKKNPDQPQLSHEPDDYSLKIEQIKKPTALGWNRES